MGERPDSPTRSGLDRGRRRWRFAKAVLDERTLELVVDGVDVELERKPLEVLTFLLQHAGEVCTKDELLAGVWPGRVLSETVLTKSIGRLRDALGDYDQSIIRTAYGFGYRLAAPVQVETCPAPPVPRFDFNPGDHPPGRPLWSLVQHLGVGGHGEAWRGKHDKTHEQRVFKFALDEASFGALKREITLFRVINDTLGEAARVVRLLDWNLELQPYFVEAEYISGGSLGSWAHARGGIAAIPIAERVEIVAKIASAVAAIHSVGVLHKDLKPSNVLMKPGAGDTEVLLADFGSGSVLDAGHIERLGITRLGFTKTVGASDASSGTPAYLAPEVLAGQPFTVKTDLYSLGVILYQFLAGDFHRVMSPGWERQIDDELLREDIALAVEGNPALRLGDADVLARRLRTLEERRAVLVEQRAAATEAEHARRVLERARARRFGLMLAFAILVAGLATSTALYVKARNAQARTEIAAARSNTVVEFLGNDVFAPVSSGNEPAKNIDVATLLTRAGNEIDTRFAKQPDIASQLHFIIGRSFESLYASPAAVRHFNRALELGEELDGEGSEAALRSASELVQIDYALGTLRASLPRYEAALAAGRVRLSPDAPFVTELRLRLARGRYLLGDWAQSLEEFEQLAADDRAAKWAADFRGRVAFHHAQLLIDVARATQAQRQLRSAIGLLTSSVGEKHLLVAESHAMLGRALAESGRYSEAVTEFEKAEELATQWAPPDTWTAVRPRYFRALLKLRQDEPAVAAEILAEIVRFQEANRAAYVEKYKDASVELDHTGPVRQALGEAYARQGRLPDAVSILQQAIEVGEKADGSLHPSVISARLSLAECLLGVGGFEGEAARLLAAAPVGALEHLSPEHPIVAQSYRVTGLLAQREQNMSAARSALAVTLRIYRTLYEPGHWRVQRAMRELRAVS